MGKKKSLGVQPEVSHERTQPLGINVRVARSCCNTLMDEERLDETFRDWYPDFRTKPPENEFQQAA